MGLKEFLLIVKPYYLCKEITIIRLFVFIMTSMISSLGELSSFIDIVIRLVAAIFANLFAEICVRFIFENFIK